MRTFACLTIAGLTMALSAMPLAMAGADEELDGAPVKARTDGHEPDTYRYGLMLRIADAGDADACEQACNDVSMCSAWSLVPASVDNGPRCELKRAIGSAISRPGAVSGIAAKFHPVALQPAPTEDVADAPTPPSIKSKPVKPKPPAPVAPAASSSSQPIIYRPGGNAGLEGGPSSSGKTTITAGPTNAPVVVKPGN